MPRKAGPKKATPKKRPTKRAPTKSAPDWRPALLRALAEHGNITRACKDAGICRDTFYVHRDEDGDFAAVVKRALRLGVDALEDEAKDRAFRGNDKLLMFLLRANKRKYRQRKEVEHKGKVRHTHATEQMSDDQLAAIAGRALAGTSGGGVAAPPAGPG